METTMTKVQAFHAAHDFLERYFREKETIGLRTVLSGMLLDEQGRSADPGTMYTWIEALASERGVEAADYDDENQPDYPTASIEEWFVTLGGFLRYYARTWKDDRFHQILFELCNVDLDRAAESRNKVWQAWQECSESACKRPPAMSRI